MHFWHKDKGIDLSRDQNLLWDMIWKTLDNFISAYSWNGQILFTFEEKGQNVVVTSKVWTSNLRDLLVDLTKVSEIPASELMKVISSGNGKMFLEKFYPQSDFSQIKMQFNPQESTPIPLVKDEICYGVLLALNDIRANFNAQDFSLVAELLSVIIEQDRNYMGLLRVYFKERDLMDILGHELRTPLTIGRNAMKYIKQDFDKDGVVSNEVMTKYLEMAEENLSREAKLLETLLSTTKIDNDAIELHLEKVDMIDVVNDSLNAFKPKAEYKGLEIKFAPQGDWFVYADRTRVQEIVDNLIDNAVKYTQKGGVFIELLRDEKNVMLKVSDTGVGIPQNDIYKLGQKFYRIDTYVGSSKESDYKVVRPGGTGLGLYVAFNLAKLMGGKIKVESEIDKGSVFVVTLPIYVGQEKKDIQAEMNDQSGSGGGKAGRRTVFERFEEMKKKKSDQAVTPGQLQDSTNQLNK